MINNINYSDSETINESRIPGKLSESSEIASLSDIILKNIYDHHSMISIKL
jgi:hypothetical protein